MAGVKLLLAVGAGSCVGGVLRCLLALAAQSKTTPRFPLGTLAANLAGCFCIGLLFALFDNGRVSSEWKIFLGTGVLGGFTTFSAFSVETFSMLRGGHAGHALLYVLASVAGGLLATGAAWCWVKTRCAHP